jgi:hypothetical protein
VAEDAATEADGPMTPGLFARLPAGRSYKADELELQHQVLRLLDTGDAGERVIEAELRAAGPREWIALDTAMRARQFEWEGPLRGSWQQALGAVLLPGVRRPTLIASGVASMGPDGHARERAVRRLASEQDPLAGPFLALRTIDWVDQVARAATEILADRLRREPLLLVAAAPLLLGLADRQRRSELDQIVWNGLRMIRRCARHSWLRRTYARVDASSPTTPRGTPARWMSSYGWPNRTSTTSWPRKPAWRRSPGYLPDRRRC